MIFDLDDDWGPSTSSTAYPALDIKQNVSRTVQKKRKRATQKMMQIGTKSSTPNPGQEDSRRANATLETDAKPKKRKAKDRGYASTSTAHPQKPAKELAGNGLAIEELPSKKQKTAGKSKQREASVSGTQGTEDAPTPAGNPELAKKVKQKRERSNKEDVVEMPAEKVAEKRKPDLGSGLLERMTKKLSGSKFRWLNETLYTTTGGSAFDLMREQPHLFKQYHEGFQQQTKSWPEQPLEAAVKWLRKLPKQLKVADFGCGDAALARTVKQKVASLDLVASSPGVIACNMSKTPLDTASMDVVTFCLALMGTDYPDFLTEASRVLKPGGRLWIAEVRSRFVQDSREDLDTFSRAVANLGYDQVRKDVSNKMFVVFEFHKHTAAQAAEVARIQWPALKPCLYKRR